MVIPRSFSSGALSIESNERASEKPASLTVVYVTDGTNVDVWFRPLKMFFSHNLVLMFVLVLFRRKSNPPPQSL